MTLSFKGDQIYHRWFKNNNTDSLDTIYMEDYSRKEEYPSLLYSRDAQNRKATVKRNTKDNTTAKIIANEKASIRDPLNNCTVEVTFLDRSASPRALEAEYPEAEDIEG